MYKPNKIKSREEFLAGCPNLKNWVELSEKYFGGFIGLTSIFLNDKRWIFLFKFEQIFKITIFNPTNPRGQQNEMGMVLSYEAIESLNVLYLDFKAKEINKKAEMTADDQIIESKIQQQEFDCEMFRHLEATNGKGCGDLNCVYCATYAQHLRDLEDR